MKTISFKVTEDEACLIRRRAKMERLSISEYIRRRAKGPASTLRLVRRHRCPHTGAMIFSALEGGVPFTTETVCEYLTDFP